MLQLFIFIAQQDVTTMNTLIFTIRNIYYSIFILKGIINYYYAMIIKININVT